MFFNLLISQIVETPPQYHIIQMTKSRGPDPRPHVDIKKVKKRPHISQNNCGRFPYIYFFAHSCAHSFFIFGAPTFFFLFLWAPFFWRPQFRPHFLFFPPTILIRLITTTSAFWNPGTKIWYRVSLYTAKKDKTDSK